VINKKKFRAYTCFCSTTTDFGFCLQFSLQLLDVCRQSWHYVVLLPILIFILSVCKYIIEVVSPKSTSYRRLSLYTWYIYCCAWHAGISVHNELKIRVLCHIYVTLISDIFMSTGRFMQVPILHIVPPIAAMMAKTDLSPYDLSFIRTVLVASAPLSATVETQLKASVNNPDLMVAQGIQAHWFHRANYLLACLLVYIRQLHLLWFVFILFIYTARFS